MKKKVRDRLLIFFIGIPVMIFSVLVCREYRHLFFHVIIVTVSVLGALELNLMLQSRKLNVSKCTAFLCGLVPALTASACIVFELSFRIVHYAIFFLFLFLICKEIFFNRSDEHFEHSLNRIVGAIFIIVYPAMLLTYVARMTAMTHSSEVIIFFMLLVFGCDSIAWFFGVTIGESTRGFIKASPQKSLAGFAGGLVATIVVVFIVRSVFSCFQALPLYKMLIVALVSGITAIIGDLGESVIKRSCCMKDSGGIIPGRGGIFDSIDSVIITAPIFYLLVKGLFGF